MNKLLLLLFISLASFSSQAQTYGPDDDISFRFTDEWGAVYEVTFRTAFTYSGFSGLEANFLVPQIDFLYMEVNGRRYTESQIQQILDRKGVRWTMNGGEPERAAFRPDEWISDMRFTVDGFYFYKNGRSVCSLRGPLHLSISQYGSEKGEYLQRDFEEFDRGIVPIENPFIRCVKDAGYSSGEIRVGRIQYDYGNRENAQTTRLVRNHLLQEQQQNTTRPSSTYSTRSYSNDDINGFFSIGFSGNLIDDSRIPGFTGGSFGGGAMLVTLEHTSFLDEDRQFGLHYGAWTQLDFMGDGYDRYEVSPFIGFNFFEYFELDYVFRGLSMSGSASGEDNNTGQTYYRDLGGDALQFHGGFRASAYLARNPDEGLLYRLTFTWVDSRPDSPVNFLALGSADGTQTQNMTIKLEGMHNGILLYLFYATESYISPETVPLGLDTFGFGLNWSVLWPNRE